MPDRKGLEIPPTKRIKIEDVIENQLDCTLRGKSVMAVQGTQNENYDEETGSNNSELCANETTANGFKYLHKKFKKVAAILSDDNVSSNSSSSVVTLTEVNNADDKSVHILPAPQSACSPIALPTSPPNMMAAAVATISVAAALPFEDVPTVGTPSSSAGRHTCPYCKLVCNKPSVLQKHIRAHTNERPYPCLPCGFAFKTRSNLYKHCRSRSHLLKLEEISCGEEGVSSGGDANSISNGWCGNNDDDDGEDFRIEADDEGDNQNDSTKNEDSTSSGEDGSEHACKSSIYKPKFHMSTNYIWNRASSLSKPETTVTSNSINKLRLQLRIPTTSSQQIPLSSRSAPSTPSSLGGSSPSPEFLQQRITKLISQNQAIVETTDSLWSRKLYMRSKENSLPSSPLPTSFEELKKNQPQPSPKAAFSREEKLPHFPVAESKLATALLRPRPVVRSASMSDIRFSKSNGSIAVTKSTTRECPQPLNLTLSKDTVKFVRPTSLPLQPGTFVPKKLLVGAAAVLPLISPETPRPNKSYSQLYIGGNAYTYLGLKCSTRNTFCTLHKSQPTYVSLSPEHNRISMYSNWKVCSEVNPCLRSVSVTKVMACYDSSQRYSPYTVVNAKMKDAVTHSSFSVKRMKFHNTIGFDNESDDNDETKSEHAEENSDTTLTQVGRIEDENCDDDEDDTTLGYGENDPKCQLEREVAESLMLLSKISHQKVSEQYANAGLVPLNARPNTYPYNYSAIVSSKPHTPTSILISEMKESETVSKNTRLAPEVLSVLEAGELDRHRFNSSSHKELAKFTSDLEESCNKVSKIVTSVFPVDLSSKNVLIVPVCSPPTNDMSNISTPVSETTLLSTMCSTKDRLLTMTGEPEISNEDSVPMFESNLKERTVHDHEVKRQYFNGQKRAAVDPTAYLTVDSKTDDALRAIPSPKRIKLTALDKDDTKVHDEEKIVERVSNTETKENVAITSAIVESMEKGNDGSTSVVVLVDSSNSSTNIPPKKLKAEFILPRGGLVTNGRSKCNMCDKVFSQPSQLHLHVNIHYCGLPFRCETCAVSFRTKGRLRKHLSSNLHLNKVSKSPTGTKQMSTSSNPRPFKCDDCSIGFRIHGHLAKHLRSKMHIMKLECLGKLPFGTYAEIERCGINMNDIDTTDCENSLESLQRITKEVVTAV